MLVTLPGKQVGKVKVLSVGGTTVADEYAYVELVEGAVDAARLAKYEIQGE